MYMWYIYLWLSIAESKTRNKVFFQKTLQFLFVYVISWGLFHLLKILMKVIIKCYDAKIFLSPNLAESLGL